VDEAIRDLARAREDAVNARTQARHQLKGFLLRRGVRYSGKSAWSKTYYRWLALLDFEQAGAQTAFTEYWQAVQSADVRVARMSDALAGSIQGWRFEPVVAGLQALRGIDQISAIGLAAEIGDIGRFAHPRQLMGYLGLVPSEHSSGDRLSRGSITKTGNAHARRLLTEAAWNYRFKPRIGYRAQRRQEALPQAIRDMAWKAQLRLTTRFAKLNARGVQINKVCVAVARELAGFIWAIAQTSAAQPAV
jgi:transposase